MQTNQRCLNPLFTHVTSDVNRKGIVTQAVTSGTRLNAGKVDTADTELFQHHQQRTGLVRRKADLDRCLVCAGGGRDISRPGSHDEPGYRARVVRNIADKWDQPVPLYRRGIAKDCIKGSFCFLACERPKQLSRRGSGSGGNVHDLGKACFRPAPTLSPRMRVGANTANVIEPRPRKRCKHKANRDNHLGNNVQILAAREGVDCCVDAAFNRVFDRDHRAVRHPVSYRFKRLGGGSCWD